MAEAVAERWVKHPRAKVWRASSDPELVAAWLPFEGYRPEVGVQFVAQGPTGLASCEVVSVHPPERVVCTWEEGGQLSTVTIELTDDVGGTRVVVRHEATDPERRKQLHGLWLLALQQGLDSVLTTGTVAAAGGGATLGTGLAIGVGVGGVVVGAVVVAVVVLSSPTPEGAAPPPPLELAAVQGVPTTQAPDGSEVDSPAARFAPEVQSLEFPPPLPPLPAGGPVMISDDLPTTLHPLYPRSEADVRSHRLVWEPLFERSAITGAVGSNLVAQSHMEGSVLVVELDAGHVFHDGQPISAEDVCFSVTTVMDPAHPSTLPFRERGDLTGCEVRGPLVAAVGLRGALPDAQIRAAVPVLPAHAFDPDPISGVSGRPVGSGPYRGARGRVETRFSAVSADAGVQDFEIWDRGDPLVEVRTLLRGGVHGIVEVPPEHRADLAASDDVVVRTWTPNVLVYLAVNPKSLPDVTTRQRLAGAIDRGMLVQRGYGTTSGDYGTPPSITGPFRASSPFTNRSVRPQAVVRDGTPVQKSQLRLGYDPDANPVMQRVATEFGLQLRAAGFPCVVKKAEGPSPTAHDLWLGSWQVDPTEDPGPLVNHGDPGIHSPKVEALLTAFRTAATDTAQQDAAHELHRTVWEEAQWIGLFEDVRESAWRTQIRNNTITPYSYWGRVTDWQVAAAD